MTTPQQPKTAQGGATIFTQDGQTTTGIAQRGIGGTSTPLTPARAARFSE